MKQKSHWFYFRLAYAPDQDRAKINLQLEHMLIKNFFVTILIEK